MTPTTLPTMHPMLLLRNSVMSAGFFALAYTIRNETASVFVVLVGIILELPILMLTYLVLTSRVSFKRYFASSLGTTIMTIPVIFLFLTVSAAILKDVEQGVQVQPLHVLIAENQDSILVLLPFLILGYILDGIVFVRSGQPIVRLEMQIIFQIFRIFGIVLAGLAAAVLFQEDVAIFDKKDVWFVAYSIIVARLFFEYVVYKRLVLPTETANMENVL